MFVGSASAADMRDADMHDAADIDDAGDGRWERDDGTTELGELSSWWPEASGNVDRTAQHDASVEGFLDGGLLDDGYLSWFRKSSPSLSSSRDRVWEGELIDVVQEEVTAEGGL